MPDTYENKDGMKSVTENMNWRHHNAQMAGRASVTLHTLLYFKNRPTIDTACVIRVKSNGAVVLVPKYGIEGPVYVCAKGKEDESDWTFDESQMSLIHSKDSLKNLKIFQEILVKIEVVEVAPHRNSLVMSLVWPEGNKRAATAAVATAVTAGGASRGEQSSSAAAESASEKKQKKRSKRSRR